MSAWPAEPKSCSVQAWACLEEEGLERVRSEAPSAPAVGVAGVPGVPGGPCEAAQAPKADCRLERTGAEAAWPTQKTISMMILAPCGCG